MDNSNGAVRTIYAVAELNEILRALVEDSLPSLWIQGEISNFTKPASGHWYFTLKDAQAQVRCAMFRKANYYIRPLPQNGDAVLVRAKASVYPARGELQLIVEHLEAAGTGALLRAFEELKARLAAEGLFDAALKRPIPPMPSRIGLITSGTGAAVHDVLTTLARRWPLAEVLFYPVPVQGAEAVPAIVKALAAVSAIESLDVLLLVRGGGSIEDLWSFNDERVARAIRACRVPVITGVGHEIDVTIADFASDLRAATPTAAAEHASPDRSELLGAIEQRQRRLHANMQTQVQRSAERLQRTAARLWRAHPQRWLDQQTQRLDELTQQLQNLQQQKLTGLQQRFDFLQRRLMQRSPVRDLQTKTQQLRALRTQLHGVWNLSQSRRRAQLERHSAVLGSLSPDAVLARGYGIVLRLSGEVVRDASGVAAGEALRLRVQHGEIEAEVRSTRR